MRLLYFLQFFIVQLNLLRKNALILYRLGLKSNLHSSKLPLAHTKHARVMNRVLFCWVFLKIIHGSRYGSTHFV